MDDATSTPPQARIYSIGHSNRTAEAFTEILNAHGVTSVADVRSFPGSRRQPQFSKETLARWLGEAGIGYVHLVDLGGRRRDLGADPDVNGGWRHAAFRLYADYTATERFTHGLEDLIRLARNRPTAYMCSEAVPWRCHRTILSDLLVHQGFEVVHLLGKGAGRPHVLGGWGPQPVFHERTVSYPPGPTDSGR